jgi:hypothetical protein
MVRFHHFKQLSHILSSSVIAGLLGCPFPLETIVGEEPLHLFVLYPKFFVLLKDAGVVLSVLFFDYCLEGADFKLKAFDLIRFSSYVRF